MKRGKALAANTRDLKLGQRVMARNAFGELKPAVVCAVPTSWRDWTNSDVATTRGEFPKTWLRFRSVDSESVPWPVEDIMAAPTAGEQRLSIDKLNHER